MRIIQVIGAILAYILGRYIFTLYPCITTWMQIVIVLILIIIPIMFLIRDDTISWNKGIDKKEEEDLITKFLNDSAACVKKKKVDINIKGTIIPVTPLNFILYSDRYTESERKILDEKGLIDLKKLIPIPKKMDNYLSTQDVIIEHNISDGDNVKTDIP
jgi:hypothetical protein